MNHNHADIKEHIRTKRCRTREKMLRTPREGKRVPVDAIGASRVATEFLNLKKYKVVNKL